MLFRSKNPQANSILERVHQVLGNMLRTKNLQKYDFDDRSELLGSVAWAICSTHHTTLQATPGQMVFGRDITIPEVRQCTCLRHLEWRKILS